MTSLMLALVLAGEWTVVAALCFVASLCLTAMACQAWQAVRGRGLHGRDSRWVLAKMGIEQATAFSLVVGMLTLFALFSISSLWDGWPPPRLTVLLRFGISSVVMPPATCLAIHAVRNWRWVMFRAEAEEDETGRVQKEKQEGDTRNG